jgi:Putative peptidoglycan binding domain
MGSLSSFQRNVVSAGCALLVWCALSAAQMTGSPSSSGQKTSKTRSASKSSKKGAISPKKTAVQSANAPKGSSSRSKSALARSSRRGKKSKTAYSRRGQQKIDSQRTTEIQEALIREHYLSGEPSGVWNDATQKAMVRYQAENGWQTKVIPDSRALIKLGLGPNQDHLLNPESAMTTAPQSRGANGAPNAGADSSHTPDQPRN